MNRPKKEDFKVDLAVISSVIKQYSAAQDKYIDFLESKQPLPIEGKEEQAGELLEATVDAYNETVSDLYKFAFHSNEKKMLVDMMIQFASSQLQPSQVGESSIVEECINIVEKLTRPNCSDHTPYRGACVSCGSMHNYDTIDVDEVKEALGKLKKQLPSPIVLPSDEEIKRQGEIQSAEFAKDEIGHKASDVMGDFQCGWNQCAKWLASNKEENNK